MGIDEWPLNGFVTGEFGIGQVALLLLLGYGALSVVRRVVATNAFDRVIPLLAATFMAPMLGLILMSMSYPCVACAAEPEWCEVVVVGVPFPNSVHQHDRGEPPIYDVCGYVIVEPEWFGSWLRNAAYIADFGVGLFGVPLSMSLVHLVWRRAGKRTD